MIMFILAEFSGEFPRGVMVNALNCRIVVSEFELQLHYYVHFRTNALGKGMNPPYPFRYGLNSTTLRADAKLNYLKWNCFLTLKLNLH